MSNVLLNTNSFPYLLPKDTNRDLNNNYHQISSNKPTRSTTTTTTIRSEYVTRSKKAVC